MSMEKIIRTSFPPWIVKCWDKYHPNKQEEDIFSYFKNSEIAYLSFDKVNWKGVYKTARKILRSK